MTTLDLKWLLLTVAGAVYLLGAVAFTITAARDHARARALGTCALVIAIALHAAAFFMRGHVAERLPVQNLFESLVAASLIGGVIALVLHRLTREPVIALAGCVAGAAGIAAGVLLPIPGRDVEPEAAILAGAPLLAWHVGVILTADAFIVLGAVVSLLYLRAPRARSASLERLDRAQVLLAQLSFITLAAGILLGAWWAHDAWGRWWGWDPKETWALITWLVYLVSIHWRATDRPPRPRRTAWLNIAGAVLALWSFFGVNLLFPGLHSYAG